MFLGGVSIGEYLKADYNGNPPFLITKSIGPSKNPLSQPELIKSHLIKYCSDKSKADD